MVALLIGCYFYQRSNEMMRVESKNLFIQALKGEMLRMERELDLSCVSMNVLGATALWTRLSVKTEFGTKDYVVDVKKDLKIYLLILMSVLCILLFAWRSSFLLIL